MSVRSITKAVAQTLNIYDSTDAKTAFRVDERDAASAEQGGDPIILNPGLTMSTRTFTPAAARGAIGYDSASGELWHVIHDTTVGYQWRPMTCRPILCIEGGWTKTFTDTVQSTDAIQGTRVYADQFAQNYAATGSAVTGVTLASAEHGIFMVIANLVLTATASSTMIECILYDNTAGANLFVNKVQGSAIEISGPIFKTAGAAMALRLKTTITSGGDRALVGWRFCIVRLGSIAGANAITDDNPTTLPVPIAGP